MKQSSMAIIGIIIVVVVVAIAALALSGHNSTSKTSAQTTAASVYNYTTAVPSTTANAVSNTTGVANSSSKSNSTSTVTNSSSKASNSTAKKYNLMVGNSAAIGNYLENSNGFTLYLLNSDVQYKNSTCTGTCATYWPPVILNGSLSSISTQSGINASALGVITRPGGSEQLTYDGWPIYLFYKDTAPGQINGNGVHAFGGVWYAVTVPKATTS